MSYCFHCMEKLNGDEAICPSCRKPTEHEVPIHHLKPGSLLRDRYMVGYALGEGGFGITYIGKDNTLDMRIAIKEYYPNGCSNRNHQYSNDVTLSQGNRNDDFEKNMQRFLSEARVLAKFVNEPGVVGVRDFFQENGTAYIVMEFLDGITLKKYIQKYGPIPARTFLPMIDPILKSLGRIHNQGLIHRDISPDNIMVKLNGQLKLLDFGAAREVTGDKSLSVMLKPGYAPEEQYRSKGNQGAWTDVYAMSATIYKCITGITPDESIQRVFEDELKKPSELGVEIPPQWEKTLMQGLSIKSSERIQSMDALRRGFSQLQEEPIRNVDVSSDTNGDRGQTVYRPEKPEVTAKPVNLPENPKQDPVVQEPPADDQPRMDQPKHDKPETVEPEPQEPRDDDRADDVDGNTQRTNKKLLPIIIAVAVVVIAAAIAGVLFLGGGGQKEDLTDTVPTERMMASDCSTVLKQEGISGGVLDVEVQETDLNEKFKTYAVTCEVTVSENGGHTEYTLKLIYEYEDGDWVLSDLSGKN